MDGLRLGTDVPRRTSAPIIIGVDFGKLHDPTAIVVTEAIKVDRPGMKPEHRFEVRHMERLPIGTLYPAVGARIAEIVRNLETRPVPDMMYPPSITLRVDGTGVGVAAVDIVRDALHGLQARLVATTLTQGQALNKKTSREWSVGKALLVQRLQALLSIDRIKLPAEHPEAQVMVRELQDFETKIDPDGDAKFGGFKVGSHDDYVNALGLAVLVDPGGAGLSTA